MLEEEGIVKSVVGNKAIILTERRGDCATCSAAKACLVKADDGETLSQALNPVGASVGDRVKIVLAERVLLKSSFYLYLVPAVGLMAGCVLGNYLGKYYGWDKNLASILTGIVFISSRNSPGG